MLHLCRKSNNFRNWFIQYCLVQVIHIMTSTSVLVFRLFLTWKNCEYLIYIAYTSRSSYLMVNQKQQHYFVFIVNNEIPITIWVNNLSQSSYYTDLHPYVTPTGSSFEWATYHTRNTVTVCIVLGSSVFRNFSGKGSS